MNELVTVTVSNGDHRGLGELLLAYHRQTEAEKGVPVGDVAELPARYRREIEDPAAAFRGQTALVATIGSSVVGCVVMTAPDDDGCEMKRLWTDPRFRGQGVAGRLVEAVLQRAAAAGVATVRLTVWHWRSDAIALYERLGFRQCASWDERDGLVCLRRAV